MSNIVRYNGESTRGLSPEIWGDLSKVEDDARMGKCSFHFDDFLGAPTLSNSNTNGRYSSYQDTGVTIQELAAASGSLNTAVGELQVAGNDADNDEGHVAVGSAGSFIFDSTAGSAPKSYFEVRVKKETVGDDGVAFAVGLVLGPVAADHLDDNTGELASGLDFIGFQCLNADGDQVNIVYQANGQAKQVVLANAVQLSADTYVNLGFAFDKSWLPTQRIRFYIDGEEQASYVTSTQIAAATFPEDVPLLPGLLTKVGSAAEVKVTYDFLGAAQYANC